MKVLAAHVTSECNEHIAQIDGLEKMRVLYGKDCLEAVHVKDIFEEKQIELIPSIFASCHPGGLLEREAFGNIWGSWTEFICSFTAQVP